MARRIVTTLLFAAMSLVALVALVAHGPGAVAGEGCLDVRAEAGAAETLDQRFARYGDNNTLEDDWTGGDGTYSVRLPDARDIWLFSDSFLGRVEEDGSRPFEAPFINNSVVVQDGGRLEETLHGGTSQEPTAFFTPADEDSWYWPQEGVVEGGQLRDFLQRFVRTGPGPWDFEWVGTDVGSLSLPDLTSGSITNVETGSRVTYGASVIESLRYTYVYGVEDQPFVNYLHLARTPRGNVLGEWEFLGSSGWSSNPADSIRLLEGIGNGVSVVAFQGRYLLVTMADSDFFGSDIVVMSACRPWGPWGPQAHVYTAPEHEDGLFSYNAHAHGRVSEDGHLLLSYDVNTFRPSELWSDVTIYRPRFVRATLRP